MERENNLSSSNENGNSELNLNSSFSDSNMEQTPSNVENTENGNSGLNLNNSYTDSNIEPASSDVESTDEHDDCSNSNNTNHLKKTSILNILWNWTKDNVEVIVLLFLSRFFAMYLLAQAQSRYYHIPIKYFIDSTISFNIKFFLLLCVILIIILPLIQWKMENGSPSIPSCIASIFFLTIILYIGYYIIDTYDNNLIDKNYVCIILLLLFYLVILANIVFYTYKKHNIEIKCKSLISIIVLGGIACFFICKIFYTDIFLLIFMCLFALYSIIMFCFWIKTIDNNIVIPDILIRLLMFVVVIILMNFDNIGIAVTQLEKRYERIEINTSEGIKCKVVITEYGDYLVVMDYKIEDKVLHIYYNKYGVIEQTDDCVFLFDEYSSDEYTKVQIEQERKD